MNKTSKHRGILYVPVLASALLSSAGIYLLWKGISYDLACFLLLFFGLATLVFGYGVLTEDNNKTVNLQDGGKMPVSVREQGQPGNIQHS
ncbi:MAG TPA: hypothetical protein VNE41_01040 [Chitinophagaceae bacterium]|nr:hypothetical protein [Chitinophagaceae bacterium]